MAKKRHHSGKSAGMSAKKFGSAGTYSTHGEAKKMMAKDGTMMYYDMEAPCFCPREVIQKYWPKDRSTIMGHEADLYTGVTKQMNQDRSDFAKIYKPGKA